MTATQDQSTAQMSARRQVNAPLSAIFALEPNRVIAWMPGQYGPDGEIGAAGWTWRYDLAPTAGPSADGAAADGTAADGAAADGAAAATDVTLTYDWSAVPEPLRERFSLPPFGQEFLEQSLEGLAQAVEGRHD